ncbi:hypothetical protein TNCV_1421881 [Trichonephila clavipes]|nr:hypothetical protein TNCV_1421881 [Trichonephila clavipes]
MEKNLMLSLWNYNNNDKHHCKELLPAPGNRSNKRRDREEDLATTGEKRSERERKESGGKKKRGVVKSRHG